MIQHPKDMTETALAQRRRVLQAAGALALTGAIPLAFGQAAGRKIKIGYVTPQTGPLAGFGEVDSFVLQGINAAFKNGISIAGKTHAVEIIVKDSQSNPNRAADVAAELS